MKNYDSLLLVSFGGPTKNDEVMPFLRRVVAGKNVPDERLHEVAKHYYHFDGLSPIVPRTAELLHALQTQLSRHALPIYFANRFSEPSLTKTLGKMREDGRERALALFTSALSSYSGCRAYREDIERAREAIGEDAPVVEKVRAFYNHPHYVGTCVARLEEILAPLDAEERSGAHLLFSAHSIPTSLARTCAYERQFTELARLVSEGVGAKRHEVVYQSRSGPPQMPWLEPDVGDALEAIAKRDPGATVVLAPFGFVADHMEVIWDLDHDAKAQAESLGLRLLRARTANAHPLFLRMFDELVDERLSGSKERPSLGMLGPSPDRCPADCCPKPTRRPPRT